jgi:hypothetical protein
LQWVAARLNKSKWAGFDPKAQTQLRQSLQRAHETRPDFFNTATSTELAFCEAVAAGKLAAEVGRLCKAFSELHDWVAEPGKWKSVADQARFVLDAHAPAAPAEKKAAAQLQGLLNGFANAR